LKQGFPIHQSVFIPLPSSLFVAFSKGPSSKVKMISSLFNQDTGLVKGPSPFPLPQEREFFTPSLFGHTPPLPGRSAFFSLSWGRGKGEGPLPWHGGGTEQRSETGAGKTRKNSWISDAQSVAGGVVSRPRQSTRVRIHPRILLGRLFVLIPQTGRHGGFGPFRSHREVHHPRQGFLPAGIGEDDDVGIVAGGQGVGGWKKDFLSWGRGQGEGPFPLCRGEN